MNKWNKVTSYTILSLLLVAGCSNDNHNHKDDDDMEEMYHGNSNDNNDSKASSNKESFVQAPTTFNSQASEGLLTLNTKNVTRLISDRAVDTSIMVAQMIWPATHKENQPGTVILAPVENWQLTMASANLIHHPNNGPILFTQQGQLTQQVINEINRLNPNGNVDGTQILVMGEYSESMKSQLADYKVDQIASTQPAVFAAFVDEAYANVSDGEYPQSVIVVALEDESQLYSLPAVNWIAHMPEPVLFVAKDEIPEATSQALAKRKDAHVYIVGPESVISVEVEQELKNYGKVTRISGKTPTENSIAFAQFKDKKTGFGWGLTEPGHGVSFISTKTPELALGAAPFSHLGKHAPVLFLEDGEVNGAMYEFLATIKPTFKKEPSKGPYNHGFLIGSEATISYQTQGILDDKLEIVSEDGNGH